MLLKNIDLAKVHAVLNGEQVEIDTKTVERLDETRKFVSYALDKNLKIYGLTTGFADLRNFVVPPEKASELSLNIIRSHDAGIGEPLPKDIVLAAMFLRANAMARGNSAFTNEGLKVLVEMINHKIIPLIPRFGSLGASGDLAYLARLGRAMIGDDVPVYYDNQVIPAFEALKKAKIEPFKPQAKEGLALTNGTSFMAGMMAVNFIKQERIMNTIFKLECLFLNTFKVVDAAFNKPVHNVREQTGEIEVADILRSYLNTNFIDHTGTQNDYLIRCLPQIFGPKYELFQQNLKILNKELNAVTDNPLVFMDNEITEDVAKERIHEFDGHKWCVLSGGNFNGEYMTQIADTTATGNAKIILTLERQMTYMLNKDRNKLYPPYLIIGKEIGLKSGHMITQYAGNALAQHIAYLGNPVSVHNLTSGNESEDIVSYGATASLKLYDQLNYIEDFLTIYLTMILQAYSIARQTVETDSSYLCEKIYKYCENLSPIKHPIENDVPFDRLYEEMKKIIASGDLININ